jgi:hypothetical protein
MISGSFGLCIFIILASDSSIQLRYPPKMQWSLGTAIWGTMWARGEIISHTVNLGTETVLITIRINLARIKVYSRGTKVFSSSRKCAFPSIAFSTHPFSSYLYGIWTHAPGARSGQFYPPKKAQFTVKINKRRNLGAGGFHRGHKAQLTFTQISIVIT